MSTLGSQKMDANKFGEAKIAIAGTGAYVAEATQPISVSVDPSTVIDLNEWVTIATLIFVVMQIGTLSPKYWDWGKKTIIAVRDFLNKITAPPA